MISKIAYLLISVSLLGLILIGNIFAKFLPSKRDEGIKGDFEKGLTSIIMLNYNGEEIMHIIMKGIEAILSQSYPKLELIVVDDHSEDQSLRLLRELSEKLGDGRMRVVSSEKRRGVAGARNIGLREAKGEFIAFIDSDAIPERDWIENLVNRLKSNIDHGACVPKLVFLTCPNLINGFGAAINRLGYGVPIGANKEENGFRYPKEVMYGAGCGILVKREVFRKIGLFDEGFLFYGQDDSDLGVRMRDAGYKIFVVPESRVFHKSFHSNTQFDANFWNNRNTIRFVLKHYSMQDLIRWYRWKWREFLLIEHKTPQIKCWLSNFWEIPSILRFRRENTGLGSFLDRYERFMREI
ncbi:MAG: glycosyltransferase family 2 protein [bacterium]|nr:glycosyltransferase family 2 protein [bacterium]